MNAYSTRDSASPHTEVPFPDADVLDVMSLLDPSEQKALLSIRDHVQRNVRHQVIDYWNRETFPFEMLPPCRTRGRACPDSRSWLFRGLLIPKSRAPMQLCALIASTMSLLGTAKHLGRQLSNNDGYQNCDVSKLSDVLHDRT